MKRICLALFFTLTTLHGQTINLSNDTAASVHPRIVSLRGVSYVFWSENGAAPAIHFRLYGTGAWSTVRTIHASSNPALSSICAEDSSRLSIFWLDGDWWNRRLMSATIIDSAVVDSVEIFHDSTSTVDFSSGHFARASATCHLVWDVTQGDSFTTYYTARSGNGAWSAKQTIIPTAKRKSGYPTSQLVEDKNHDLLCLFFFGDSLRMLRKVSGGWLEGRPLTRPDYDGIGRSFVAAADDSLTIHIVSLPAKVMTCPCNYMLYAKWDGQSWSAIERVPSKPKPAAYYTQCASLGICFSKDCYPVITYEQQCYDMYLNPYEKVIGTSVKTTAGWHANSDFYIQWNIGSPNAAVDRNNDILYVWQDASDGDADVYYSKTALLTTVEEKNDHVVPGKISLSQNFPNPFNPTTTITYRLSSPAVVALRIYDMLGREIASLASGMMPAGEHTVQWNASDVCAGVYYYRLQAGNSVATKKLLLVK